jgi:hypothetical protein
MECAPAIKANLLTEDPRHDRSMRHQLGQKQKSQDSYLLYSASTSRPSWSNIEKESERIAINYNHVQLPEVSAPISDADSRITRADWCLECRNGW